MYLQFVAAPQVSDVTTETIAKFAEPFHSFLALISSVVCEPAEYLDYTSPQYLTSLDGVRIIFVAVVTDVGGGCDSLRHVSQRERQEGA